MGMCIRGKSYYWSTAGTDSRLKTRNITTETFAVYGCALGRVAKLSAFE